MEEILFGLAGSRKEEINLTVNRKHATYFRPAQYGIAVLHFRADPPFTGARHASANHASNHYLFFHATSFDSGSGGSAGRHWILRPG
jgi:hypothetical protein